MGSSKPSKRPRLENDQQPEPARIRQQRAAFLASMSRSISPPVARRSSSISPLDADSLRFKSTDCAAHSAPTTPQTKVPPSEVSPSKTLRSPFQLTTVRDLSEDDNLDTVSLGDILGNPLIKEAWIFNFCFDVDWVMSHFDSDVRTLVAVKIVHGSWRREDPYKIHIDDACDRWPNVESITAYLPDPFGTHHSKMFILFMHDEQAQIVIHTANMLAKDWTNMTQAVWRSPLLPKVEGQVHRLTGPVGSGFRFKQDLTSYLKAYGAKTKALVKQLQEFDFRHVRGALVASVPSRTKYSHEERPNSKDLWGYPSLRRVLHAVSNRVLDGHQESNQSPHIVCQVSSIATLPITWLDTFKDTLFCPDQGSWAHASIIYPTASNVRQSLDGYAAGASIHTKAQKATHLKQISSLRKQLCQWTRGPVVEARARRELAAPHIKTYIRFRSTPTEQDPAPDIDWALLTSANLSTQAWGTAPKASKGSQAKGEMNVHIQSYEIGVLVWPELYVNQFGDEYRDEDLKLEIGHDGKRNEKEKSLSSPIRVRMVPVFGRDTPESPPGRPESPPADESNEVGISQPRPPQKGACTLLVGLRMPYDLPLTPYAAQELPWSPQSAYDIPDRHGRRWPPDETW